MEREHSAPANGVRVTRAAGMRMAAALLGLLWIGAVQAQDPAPAADAPTPAQDQAPPPADSPVSSDDAAAGADAQPSPDAPQLPDSIPVADTQPAAPIAPPAATPSDAVHLDDVEVTATKRVKKLRDIPASITALNGEDLERNGAQSAEEILKTVPGITITSTGDTPARITIRGIASDIATSATTGILFGNVSFTDSYVPFLSLDPNPFDLQSVEVLKGPQGTLFGTSALNGAVRYVPTAPQLGVWQARYFGQYTQVQDGGLDPSYGAAVNVPIGGDSAAVRVMGFIRHSPGWIDNQSVGVEDANYLDQSGLRGMLDWHPTDKSDVAFTYATQNTHSHDPSLADNTDGELKTNNRPRLSFNNNKYDLANLSLRYSFDWADLISESAYILKNGHNFFEASDRLLPNPPIPLDAQEYFAHSNTYSQEFRLASPSGNDSPWQWVAGVSAFQQDLRQKLQVPLGDISVPIATLIPILNGITPGLGDLFGASGSPNVLAGDLAVRIRELALFGDVTRTLFDNWELSVGGRLYRTSSGGSNTMSGAYVLASFLKPQNILTGNVSEKGFNPKASLTWHASHDVLAYAAVSKGFRVGGIQPGLTTKLSPNPPPELFKSDSIWNYETGLRTQWLDNTLHLDVTGFLEEWKTPQTIQQDASGLAVYIDNVGGVRSTGGELSLQYLFPIEGLRLTATGAYTNTVTTKDFTSSKGTNIPAGTQWALAPHWQTATTLAYLRPVSDWLLGGSVTHTFFDKAISDIASQNRVYGYRQWDAQLSASNPALQWLPEVALTVNNLTNERGVTNFFKSGVPTPALSAVDVYYIQPRAVTLRLMGHFGE